MKNQRKNKETNWTGGPRPARTNEVRGSSQQNKEEKQKDDIVFGSPTMQAHSLSLVEYPDALKS